jgi:hypothetical protein
MIRNTRTEALARMRAVNPVSVEELHEAIGEAELLRAIRRAIAAGDAPARPIPAGDRVAIERGAGDSLGVARTISRHRSVSVGFGLACIAVVAVLVVLVGGGSVESVKDGGRPPYAAAAVKVAESNPRLLVTAPGWSIIHANSFAAEYGGLTYKDAGHPAYGPEGLSLTMNWAPASLYRTTLRGYRPKATVTKSIVLGRHATTFHYAGRPAYVTVLPPQGNVFVTLALPADEHETLLRSVRAVSVDRWLAAMPPEVVQPAAESAVSAQMLQEVPLPPGFDLTSLEAEADLTTRFELGRAVAGAVACGWLESCGNSFRRLRHGPSCGRGDERRPPLVRPPPDGPRKGLPRRRPAGPRQRVAGRHRHRRPRNRRRAPASSACGQDLLRARRRGRGADSEERRPGECPRLSAGGLSGWASIEAVDQAGGPLGEAARSGQGAGW